jgi:hypothetical protein
MPTLPVKRVQLQFTVANGTKVSYYPKTRATQISDLTAGVTKTIQSIYMALPPEFYDRPSIFTSNKTSITIPTYTAFMVNGRYYCTEQDTIVSIPSSISASARAGKDVYLYAVENSNANSTIPVFVLSMNSTYPDGYTAATSRKLGGFHCLCVAAGTLATYTGAIAHPLSGYAQGDILPASCWDLYHRPVASPEGMVYSKELNLWVDIYLPSVSGSQLVSVYGGTIADGATAEKFHWYKFSEWFPRSKKRLATQPEFMSFAAGSNVQTNIYGSADPGTTGGHKDTNNRRMISYIGVEDCCGVMWQWGFEAGGPNSGASWADAYDTNDDAKMRGSHYNAPNRGIIGDYSSPNTSNIRIGTRSCTNYTMLTITSTISGRGVSEPKAVPHNV